MAVYKKPNLFKIWAIPSPAKAPRHFCSIVMISKKTVQFGGPVVISFNFEIRLEIKSFLTSIRLCSDLPFGINEKLLIALTLFQLQP